MKRVRRNNRKESTSSDNGGWIVCSLRCTCGTLSKGAPRPNYVPNHCVDCGKPILAADVGEKCLNVNWKDASTAQWKRILGRNMLVTYRTNAGNEDYWLEGTLDAIHIGSGVEPDWLLFLVTPESSSTRGRTQRRIHRGWIETITSSKQSLKQLLEEYAGPDS